MKRSVIVFLIIIWVLIIILIGVIIYNNTKTNSTDNSENTNQNLGNFGNTQENSENPENSRRTYEQTSCAADEDCNIWADENNISEESCFGYWQCNNGKCSYLCIAER